MPFCPLMTQSGLGTKIAAVRDGSVSGDFGRYSVRTLFPLRADAELYRQRRATGQILALLQFRDDRRPQLPCLALKRNLHDYPGGLGVEGLERINKNDHRIAVMS